MSNIQILILLNITAFLYFHRKLRPICKVEFFSNIPLGGLHSFLVYCILDDENIHEFTYIEYGEEIDMNEMIYHENELQPSIEAYWTRRASSYTDVIKKNLADGWEDIWANELISYFPKGEACSRMKILDIGTGPGFYSIILSKRGYQMTAIDSSEGMLEEAKHNAGELADNIEFLYMDAQKLDFEDNTFDVIVTRNLTWNLPKPAEAYKEWKRVLKPNGILLNCDANWYSYLFDEEKEKEYLQDRLNTVKAGVEDHGAYEEGDMMEDISRCLPMGKVKRPQWDLSVLLECGFKMVSADTSVGERVWNAEEKVNYASTPGFMIVAVK